MDATYERILETVNAKPRPQRELAKSIITWIAYARRPLPIDTLAYAISIGMDTKSLEDLKPSIPTEDSIISDCANLVSVDRHGARFVRFVHFSLQEFLTSHRSTTISMQCDIGHRKIGQACMIFLTLYSGQSDLLASDNSREWFDEYSDDELPGDSDDEALDDSDDEALNGSDAEALDDSDAEAIEYIRNEYLRS